MEQLGKKQNGRIQEACPACGMMRKKWPGEGVERRGTLYCCRGCAAGTGCVCCTTTDTVAERQPASRSRRR